MRIRQWPVLTASNFLPRKGSLLSSWIAASVRRRRDEGILRRSIRKVLVGTRRKGSGTPLFLTPQNSSSILHRADVASPVFFQRLLQASLEIRVDLFSHCVQLIQQVFLRIDPQDHRPRVIPFRYEERRLSKVRFVEEFPQIILRGCRIYRSWQFQTRCGHLISFLAKLARIKLPYQAFLDKHVARRPTGVVLLPCGTTIFVSISAGPRPALDAQDCSTPHAVLRFTMQPSITGRPA